jgi:PEP-CTERM motif
MTVVLRAGLCCLALATGTGAAAAPVSLTKAEFNLALAGLATLVEDFENYPNASDFASPFVIANGAFAAGLPRVQSSAALCGDADQCLFDSRSAQGVRTFDAFPPGTQFWGADLHLVDVTDTLELTVTGGGGMLALELSGADFAGFMDPLGLTSVAIENLGTDLGGGEIGHGNYSFDNVTTAPNPFVVPEPGAVALLGAALAGLVLVRRFRPA